MDDYYCFRKIKSTALVMIAVVAVHVALSLPLGYYWNAFQARLSGIELSLSGVPSTGNASQGFVIYLLLFGVVALLAFFTSPRRTSIWMRLILVVPLAIFIYSAYLEYEKISPVSEKFKDIYDSLEYAIFVPHLAITAVTALYLVFVIVLPMFGITQAFGWVAAVVAIISYLGSALFIVYSHTMTILEGTFGASDFYTYLAVFALDVVSYFVLLSVLMTYCTIKREERWDRLEARSIAEENGQDFGPSVGLFGRSDGFDGSGGLGRFGGSDGLGGSDGSGRFGRRTLFGRKRARADEPLGYDERLGYAGDAGHVGYAGRAGYASGDLRRRYIPDIEDLKEHELCTSEYGEYGEHEKDGSVAGSVGDDKPKAGEKPAVKGKPAVGEKPAVKDRSAVDDGAAVRGKPGSKKKLTSKRTSPAKSKPVASVAEDRSVVKKEPVAERKPAVEQSRVAREKSAVEQARVAGEKPAVKKPPIDRDGHRAERDSLAKDKPIEEKESAMKYESVAEEYKSVIKDEPVVANRANRNVRGDARKRVGSGNARADARPGKRPRER